VATSKMVKQFEDFGGILIDPLNEELKTLGALRLMEQDPHPSFGDWLKTRQHASTTQLMRQAIPDFFAHVENGKVPAPPPVATASPASQVVSETLSPDTIRPISAPTFAIDLTLGHRLIGDEPAPGPTTMPWGALGNHGVVFAGAGSGKAVLLKRLIEDAALIGVPSIVIDCAGELAAIGDRWASAPLQWSPADAELADKFLAATERVIWTPGLDSGNPIGLASLPDLVALTGSAEELKEAVVMAVDALAPAIATGARAVVPKKRAILTNALTFLSRQGDCSVAALGAVLRNFPDAATTKIAKERQIAQEMADNLFAQLTVNPLFRSAGPTLDAASLFGPGGEKTRVSVISLVGLATIDEQRAFLSRLAMTLFSWVKRDAAPAHLPLRGLLIIDEARDFLPSQQPTACLTSMQKLAVQARKYGLGIVLATQDPDGIDHALVAQCATRWYGKMNSPGTIDAATELLKARGAAAEDDVGSLKIGRFYVSNPEYFSPPVKLMTPMCLSANAEPLELDQVLLRARASREELEKK